MFFRVVPRSDEVIAERVYCHWITCNSKISDERPLAPREFMLLPIFTFFPVPVAPVFLLETHCQSLCGALGDTGFAARHTALARSSQRSCATPMIGGK